LSVGDIRSQIAAEWLQIAQRSQWRAYRKLPSLFLMVPSLTSYDFPFPPKWGFNMPLTYANGHISATGVPIHFMFGSRVGFSGTADLMALFSIRTNSRFTIYLYSAHRAVIFAIAQLSCYVEDIMFSGRPFYPSVVRRLYVRRHNFVSA